MCMYADQRAVVLDVMQCTHDVFVEHGIPYFLDYGSLLGSVRHKVIGMRQSNAIR